MSKSCLLVCINLVMLGSACAEDFSQFVDPFIGTDGTGHTFPGAAYPFGMVQVSPDTNNHSWDHTSGYQYKDDSIMGFSQNHLSGTGISDLGDILLQPFVGDGRQSSFRSTFERTTQTASPGYYAVTLTDHKVTVELTASEHVAFHKYSYLEDADNKLYVDFQHGIINNWLKLNEHVIDSTVEFEGDDTIVGFIETASWVQHKTFFVLKFDQPFTARQQLAPQAGERAPKYVLSFDKLADQQLQVKVALSTVSVDGAKKNLQAEVADWDFARVRQAARDEWNRYLSRIEIEAPLAQKEIFYSGLYHMFIQPNITSDVDGQYRGYDDKIYQAYGDGHYSTFSLWDTYRAAHPLYTILVPEKVDEFVNSLLAQHEVQTFLPIWGLMNKETYTMIGNHSIPVVVDAVLKKIPGIDRQRAYMAVKETATINHKNSDWVLYEEYGYYPFDKLGRDGESVSRTLESTYDDFAVAQLAGELGEHTDYERFIRRSGFYRNLFDPTTGFMRGKDSNGQWRPDFDPLVPTSPMNNPGDYTEANAYQYSWAAQHAPAGMIELFGSKEKFVAKLDEFFTTTSEEAEVHLGQEALIGQYAHGNEPSHHIAYLYQFAGRPDKTEQMVHRIYNDFYDNTPDGIQGNEDCGQMSAWYVFSTMGFYPVNPSSGTYVLGLPQVIRVRLKLPAGKELIVSRDLEKEGSRQIKLRGEQIQGFELSHQQLMQGGNLEFEGL